MPALLVTVIFAASGFGDIPSANATFVVDRNNAAATKIL